MRYIVTGGCGFIGSHLVHLLKNAGHDVVVIDDLSTGALINLPDDTIFYEDDVRDSRAMEKIITGADGCFHLAAIASVEKCRNAWADAHSVNVAGAVSVFDACQKNAIPVVYASSAAIYGANKVMPLSEDAKPAPVSSYGLDKLCNEHYAALAKDAYAMRSTGLRFFNVYGEGQAADSPYSGVITQFATKIQENAPITIYGDGKQSRDFVHVTDVARACAAAMEKMRKRKTACAEVYNVCTSESISVNALAKTMMKVAGVTVDLEYGEAREGEVKHSKGDNSLLKKKLKITPEMKFEEGIAALLGSEEAACVA